MKKFVKAIAIALVAFAAVSLTSCNNESSSLVTEIKLEAPVLTVKAFPGYNYVAWLPVDGASSIVVYRDDGKKITNTVYGAAVNDGGYNIDSDIKNGVEYKYTAYAFLGNRTLEANVTTPGATTQMGNWDEVILKEGGAKTTESVKAIVPQAGTRALDLIDYDNGNRSGFKLDAKNVKVQLINNSIVVSFPTKGYLKYTVKLYKGNELETFDSILTDGATAYTGTANSSYVQSYYTVDGNYAGTFAASAAGEYTVTVDVTSNLTGIYPASDTIKVENKVTVKGLDVATETGTPAATYLDKDTVRILWTPAKNHNNEAYAASKYSLYYQNTFTNYWNEISKVTVKTAKVNEDGTAVTDKDGNPVYDEKLESAIKTAKAYGKDVYYVDWKITEAKVSNEVVNNFRVVLKDADADGTPLYEAYKSCTLNSPYTAADAATVSAASTSFVDLDADGNVNDLVVTVDSPNKLTTISAVKYALRDSYTNTSTFVDDDFKNALTVIDATGKNTFVIKDVAVGKYVSLVAVTTAEAKVAKYTVVNFTNTPSVTETSNGSGITVSLWDIDEDKDLTSKDVVIEYSGLTKDQTIVNAKYALSTVSSGVADSLLYSDKAVKIEKFTTIENGNNGTFVAYSFIKDIAKETNVSVYLEIKEAGKANKVVLGTVNTSTLTSAYDGNLNPTAEVSYVALDEDGILNDAVILVRPAKNKETKITSVKYAISTTSSDVASVLLSMDQAKALAIPTAEQTSYTWVVKDVAKDNYIKVYAKAEKETKYGFAVSSYTGQAASAAKGVNADVNTEANKLTVKYVALGEDKIANDALIQVKLPDVYYNSTTGKYVNSDKKLAEVKYISTKYNNVNLLYTSEAKTLTIPTTTATTEPRTFYYFVVENVAEGNYTFAYAKFTEKNEFCEATAKTGANGGVATVSYKTAATPATVNVSVVAQDADKVNNDVRIDVSLNNKDNKLKSILYVIVDENTGAANITTAADIIKSTDVKAVALTANTFTYYLKDLKANAKVYVTAEVECKDKVNAFGNVNSTIIGDLTAADTTYVAVTSTGVTNNGLYNAANDPSALNNFYNISYNAKEADGKLNDIPEFTITTSAKQTLAVSWVKADKTYLLDNQFFMNAATVIANPAATENKDAAGKVVVSKTYKFADTTIVNVAKENYVAIKVVISETGKKDIVRYITTTSVAAE